MMASRTREHVAGGAAPVGARASVRGAYIIWYRDVLR